MGDLMQMLTQLPDDIKPWLPVIGFILPYARDTASGIARAFQKRYGADVEETQQIAIDNGASAIRKLDQDIQGRLSSGELSEDELPKTFMRPDIAKPMQDALISASETSDELTHTEIARLIGARLVAPQDSRVSLLLRIACQKIPEINSRQIRMLGLVFVVLYLKVQPRRTDESPDMFKKRYTEAISQILTPYSGVTTFPAIDFIHLETIGLLKLLSWSTNRGIFDGREVSLSNLLIGYDAHFAYDGAHFPAIERLRSLMTGSAKGEQFAFQSIRMTPTGYLVGQCMNTIVSGIPFVISNDWDETSY